MKLATIALDYDGTIAQRDALDPSVRAAIAAARTRGITVLLVTGRLLDDLRRVAGDLHFVDGVIAENGALIHFPDSGYTTTLAPPVPKPFVAELQRRGVRIGVGRCLVDADANDAPVLLDVIRRLALPLVLLFNGGRVMTLSQGVSKATGLQTALDTLRLSPRNALAIGDAENDHELLRLAEVGVAVNWGSAALKNAADLVLPGEGPPAVAAYIGQLAASGRLPIPPRARRRLLLGYTEDGREFSLAVRGRNVLIAGDARSGKSWAAGLLCEQLILHGYSLCVIDPEGDYRTLEALPGVTVLGGDDPPPTPRDLLHALRYPDRSTVIDLSHLPQDQKVEYIRAVLPALSEMRRRTGLPHRILVDEAHYFLHDADAARLLDLDGHGYTVVSYWASRLPRELLATTEVMLVTCESSPSELEALRQWCATCQGMDAGRWALLPHLRVGQAVALPVTAEAGGDLRLFTLAPRLTPHVRHREKYLDTPVPDHRAFVFTDNGRRLAPRAHTLRQFVSVLDQVPAAAVDSHLQRGDFSRWVRDVFGDHQLASTLRAVEERRPAVPASELVPEVATAIRARYDLLEEDADWSATDTRGMHG